MSVCAAGSRFGVRRGVRACAGVCLGGCVAVCVCVCVRALLGFSPGLVLLVLSVWLGGARF